MRYLLGDSSESGLEFNYLAFLKEVLDCSVVLVEHETALAAARDRRKAREQDAHAQAQAIEDLGKRAQALFGPIAKDNADSPLGRCASAIASATREKIAHEAAQIRSALAGELEVIEKDSQRLRTKTLASLEKLLKTHDLPDASKSYEVLWTANGVKAQMRQRTSFGVEAVLALDVPASSLFTTNLHVERVTEGVEINALESGGWLKKADKLVPHKLGRYLITRVMVGTEVTIRLRTALDSSASGFDVIVPRVHENPKHDEVLPGGILVDRIVGTPKEVTIDKHQQASFHQLADKLEKAARALGDHRTSLVAVEIDGTSIGDHGHPLVFVERFMLAIGPTVQRIARHSRSPGELVLRRLIGDDRREEIFVTTADLLKRIEGVTGKAREAFAPLHLEGGVPPPPPRTRPPSTRPPSILRPPHKSGPFPTQPIDLDQVEELAAADSDPSASGTIPVTTTSGRMPALIIEEEPAARDTRPRSETGDPEISVSSEATVIVDEPTARTEDPPRAKSETKPRVRAKSKNEAGEDKPGDDAKPSEP